MMPLELYSTELAYSLVKTTPRFCGYEDERLGLSVGDYPVILATVLLCLVIFVVNIARKLQVFAHVVPPKMGFEVFLRRWGVSNTYSSATRNPSLRTPILPNIPILTNAKTLTSLQKWFPGSLSNQELVEKIKKTLEPHGYCAHSSLIATSLCCDEVNRPLEKDLAGMYDDYFAMGGLAGVPFGGVTAFAAMASHIPDGGSCLIVYGPHVGIDRHGNVGTINRSGKVHGGDCCGSAIAAATTLQAMSQSKIEHLSTLKHAQRDPFDAQQSFVEMMLVPYSNQLKLAEKTMAELPYAMYDAQTELMEKILRKGCHHVAGNGKIALLGGIQINTPKNMPDFFLPLRFDIYDNHGKLYANVSGAPPRPPVATIALTFPRALTNTKLIDKVLVSLEPFGYGKRSLLCTSLCCDEVARPLEKELQEAFGDHFNIGGLAGFAFGGATGFAAMAQHIPDGGNCLIVYGPHVGVDSRGNVGTVDRRGRICGGACCGSGAAAAAYVQSVTNGAQHSTLVDPLDAQQTYVNEMLLPYANQIATAEDPMVELPFSLFQAQDKLMQKIVMRKRAAVPRNARIALLGGIQINTPDGVSDYFLPLRFEVLKSNGEVLVDLLFEQKVAEVPGVDLVEHIY